MEVATNDQNVGVGWECFHCHNIFPEKVAQYSVGVGDDVVCEDCFDEYSECHDCENYYRTSGGSESDVDGNFVCSDCIQNYYTCDDCGQYVHENSATHARDQVYCQSCYERQNDFLEEGEDCYTRGYSKTSKKFISKPSILSTILSERIYSTEIETISGGYKTIARCMSSEKIPREVGFEGDGSLSSNGIEVITPMLAGIAGENLIKDVCKELQKNDFTVDRSCGLHIHLDVPEIKQNKQQRSLKNQIKQKRERLKNNLFVEQIGTTLIAENIKPIVGNIKIGNVSLSYLGEIFHAVGEMRKGIVLLAENGFIDEAKAVYNEMVGIERALEAYSDVSFIMNGAKIENLKKDYSLPNKIENYVIIEKSKKEIDQYIADNFKTHNPFIDYLKNLMTFYLNYENVIFSFLPLSRRQNRYCIPLSHLYHQNEVDEASYIEDFEKMWYRDNNRLNIEERKKNKYDSTRYCGINFHSLLSNGHIEIRFHAGTIDPDKIIHWIALNTAILDYCQSEIKRTNTKTLDLKEKTKEMLDLLNIKEETKQYFLARQDKFLQDNEAKN